ncbi:MAG: galactose mutarotase [Ruminococcaceae bacterium]|nr:galactose mutarotase [Oscillospiraceae bacterium]
MSIKKKLFGTLADGREVYAYTLRNANGMKVKIITYGGAIVQIKVPDKKGCFTDVIGGYDCLESYVGGDGYQGALIGRWGNRICKGKFTLEGKDYSLFINNGENHLHGGEFGFNAKVWEATEKDGDEPELILHILSPDGDEGYPGNLDLTVTYKLSNENGLSIRYEATTDKATPINLTNHTYFNIRGYASGSIHPLILWLDADSYLPTDAGLIPTGEIRSVEGTPFDFRTPKEVGRDINADCEDLVIAGGYDHCLNFVGGETKEPVKRAELYDPESGRVMTVYTNQPCVQLYSGNFLTNEEYPFKGGYTQKIQTLMCLETQHMPDSINHPNFTNTVLKPGEKYDYTTEYRFSVK